MAGYVPGTGISDKVIVEPSCGCGAFLTVIAGRLADDAIAVGKGWTSLGNAIRAYDIDSASIETARKAAVEALMTRGCPAIQARELCEQWIVHGDFILDDVPDADFIVGNPPYVRAVEIDRTKRSLYVKRLSSVTTGCDLYVSFFDRGLDALRDGGTLCFICADRWLQNKYGTLLRSRMGTDCDLVSLVRMHGVDAFDDEVDAYPAVTTIRKGVVADHLKFVNCAPEFNEADATAVLDWLMDDEPDLVGERFEAFEIDKPTGNRMYPLGNHDLVRFVSQACERLPKLEEAGVKLGIGIATGCDDVFLTEDDDLVESDRMVPIFYMRDHRRGNDDRRRWLVNPWNDDGTLVSLDEYPRLKTYLETNKERLSRRYVAKRIKLPGTALSTSSHLDCLTGTFYLYRIWRFSPIRFCRMESIRITTAIGSLPMSGIWRFSAACLWPIRRVVSSMRLVSRCVEGRCAFRHSTCAWCICRNIAK